MSTFLSCEQKSAISAFVDSQGGNRVRTLLKRGCSFNILQTSTRLQSIDVQAISWFGFRDWRFLMTETQLSGPVRTGRLAGVGLREPGHAPSARRPRAAYVMPDSILHDERLNADISQLPSNYSFEIHKTVWRVRKANAKRVALQMPEGLLMYATMIADILRKHACAAETVVLADVTYGACCVDDLSAKALGCDFLVHYGHSCLVPVQTCAIPMLYVFVHIAFDPQHLIKCLHTQFEKDARIALVGTIQFVDTLHAIRPQLMEHFTDISVPQSKPLSPGELLGCTSPKMADRDVLVYVGDGRFHLESAMIANPRLPAYRYDPYAKTFTIERYAHDEMRAVRKRAVDQARGATNFGIILGTLGRQGSPNILERIQGVIRDSQKNSVTILLSEITPGKIKQLEKSGVQAWIQIACPRLSIDWGTEYGERPLLTPYEAYVALGATDWKAQYPMDYYAKDGGEWANYYKPKKFPEAGRRDL